MMEPASSDSDSGSRWRALLAVIAIIGITALTFGADLLLPDQPARPVVPGDLPSLRADEGPVAVFDAATRLTVIRFWSTTCARCEEEILEMRALAGDFPEVRFVAAAVDRDRSDAAALAAGLESPLIAVSDSERTLARALEVSAVPATVIVDRNRSILRRFNAIEAAALRTALVALERGPDEVYDTMSE